MHSDQYAQRGSGRRTDLRLWDLLLVGIFSTVVVVGVGVATRWIPGSGLGVVGLIFLQAGLQFGVVAAIIIGGKGWRLADLGFVRPAVNWIWLALPVTLVLILVTGPINYAVQSLMDEPATNPQLQMMAPAGFSIVTMIGMVLAAGLFVPIVEEILFRGLLHRYLRGYFNFWAAGALSSILFAAVHGIMFLIPALTIVGFVLAWIYERSGSLWPAIIVHGLFNSMMIIILYAALASGADLAMVGWTMTGFR